jgi:peptide/nickel transport system ATP-binding protein
MPRVDAGNRQRLTPIKGSPPSLINPPPGCPFGPRCPLHYSKCDEQEPDLYPTDRPDHTAACIRVDELVGADVAAEDIFTDDSSDLTLGAEAAIGESALAQQGVGDAAAAGGVPTEPPPIPGVDPDAHRDPEERA